MALQESDGVKQQGCGEPGRTMPKRRGCRKAAIGRRNAATDRRSGPAGQPGGRASCASIRNDRAMNASSACDCHRSGGGGYAGVGTGDLPSPALCGAQRPDLLICGLYLRAHNIGLTGDGEFSLPLSQLVLADALGMTAVQINRVFKELRLAEAMALKRGSVTLLDPVKLVQIAGFDENYLHGRLRQLA
jgi:hypothetical protein